MILIIGPAFSGKSAYAHSLQEKIGGGEIMTEVQEQVSGEMEDADVTRLAEDLCRSVSVLTASETGAGIVPVGRLERRRRENQGRLLCELSFRAVCVVRVFYGIPEVIKGSIPEKTEPCVELWLFRHGYTQYNLQKKYQGRTDLALLEEEKIRIRPLCGDIFTKDEGDGTLVAYVSPALRARQTARLLMPWAKQIVIPEFMEMDFGIFEGRSADEMSEDARYRSWVDSMCEDPVPGGESRGQFCARVTKRFEELARRALREGVRRLVIVAHGGTQMAVMERFGAEKKPYWTWQSAPGGAWTGRIMETAHGIRIKDCRKIEQGEY